MSSNNYYLIGKEIGTDKFTIIEIKSKWYLKNGNDVTHRANRLEAIDLVTTRFRSREDMASLLFKHKYIPNTNYDFFIVSKYKRNGEDRLRLQEVIYDQKPERTNYFRAIAYKSLDNSITSSKDNLRLYDRFVKKFYYKPEYRKLMSEGFIKLPIEFKNLFPIITNYSDVPYNLKYNQPWMLDNYNLSRNIVYSFNASDNFPLFRLYVNDANSKVRDRAVIKHNLLVACDKDHIEGQMSIFDNYKVVDTIIGEREKLNYVLSTLTNMDLSMIDPKSYKIYLDKYKFRNVSNEDKKILKNSLKKSLVTSCYLYNFHKSKLEKSEGIGDYNILCEDMHRDYTEMKEKLVGRTLDSAYQFSLVYNSIREKDKTYEKKFS